MAIFTTQDLEQAKAENKLEIFLLKTVDNHRTTIVPGLKENMDYFTGDNPILKSLGVDTTFAGNKPGKIQPRLSVGSNFVEIGINLMISRYLRYPVTMDAAITKTNNEGEIVEIIEPSTIEKLERNTQDDPESYDFLYTLMKWAYNACIYGVGHVFWKNGSVQLFNTGNDWYFDLKDERTSKTTAGIRYWQINTDKPMYIQLYTETGLTEWKRNKKKDGRYTTGFKPSDQDTLTLAPGFERGEVPYVRLTYNTPNGDTEDRGGRTYNGFPVIPMYANNKRRSEVTSVIKGLVNLHDVIFTFHGDDILMNQAVFWVLKGYTGDSKSLVDMLSIARELKILAPTDYTEIKAENVNVDPTAVDSILARIATYIFKFMQVIDPDKVAAGGVTATAVQATQMAADAKSPQIKTEMTRAIKHLLRVAGIENEQIIFKEYRLVNELEIVQALAQLDLPKKILWKLAPQIPNDMLNEIVEEYEREGLAFSDKALEDMERKIREAEGENDIE